MVFVPLSFNDSSLAPEDGESIYLLKVVPYKSKEYWEKNKFLLAEKMIDNVKVFIPNLRRYIEHMEIATPHTLYRYTLNQGGASRGWGAGLSTTGLKMLDSISPIKGLFMAGHWAPSPVGNGGIAMSAYSGFQTARQIKYVFRDKTM
jgi:prolycopene isomerase